MGQRRFKGKMGKNKSVGYGFVGEDNKGKLGWHLPVFLDDNERGEPSQDDIQNIYSVNPDIRLYLCKITVERVKDSLGRPITMKVKG